VKVLLDRRGRPHIEAHACNARGAFVQTSPTRLLCPIEKLSRARLDRRGHVN
jgi:hypothetical protein